MKLLLSKGSPRGQWRSGLSIALFAALALSDGAKSAQGRSPAQSEADGALRYATLRSAPVNARQGPGEDYKALWTFQAKGVPVQIVESAQDWRRICDPEGGLAWVRARALESRRTVMRTRPSDLPMRRRPNDDAKPAAVLAARATASLSRCKAGWCKIAVDHASGWVRAAEVWGVAEERQCR